MSYILDALRRADSERERGLVPDIHARPVPLVSAEGHSIARARAWALIAFITLAAAAAALMWNLVDSKEKPPDTSPMSVVVQPVADVGATQSPASAADAAPTAAPPPQSNTLKPIAPSLQPDLVPFIHGSTPVAAAPATVGTRMPAKESAATDRVFALDELPGDIQRALPKLLIGGSVYSKDAASRFLIVNGQVLHEGDKLAPDLALESIMLKAAVFKYKNYRYELEY